MLEELSQTRRNFEQSIAVKTLLLSQEEATNIYSPVRTLNVPLPHCANLDLFIVGELIPSLPKVLWNFGQVSLTVCSLSAARVEKFKISCVLVEIVFVDEWRRRC